MSEVDTPDRTPTERWARLMALAEYAQERCRTARLEHIAFGLGEEAGEVLGKFKRLDRGDFRPEGRDVHWEQGHEATPDWCMCAEHVAYREAVSRELGDLLFYLLEMCARMGKSVDQVAHETHQRLLDRRARGVTKGSGDNR